MKTPEKPKVLYLDDDEGNLISFTANFRKHFSILTSSDPMEALEMIKKEGVQVAITDQNMPKITGVEFLEKLANDHPTVQRVLLTGQMNPLAMIEAVNRGKVCNIITKPFNLKEIQSAIYLAFENFKMKRERENAIKKLAKQNEQFEFMLRQQLLS
jgi:DNA-binding NtrC family response regulator